MFKKYFILLMLLSCVLHFVHGQDKGRHPRLQSISSVGLLNGSKGASFTVQTILGGALRNSFLGIGAGIDYYRYRTLPLFVDIRHHFGTGERHVFVYGDIGHNFDWLTEKDLTETTSFSGENNYKGGLYYDVGAGYNIGLKKADALVLSVGYTFKKITNEAGTIACPITGPCYGDLQTYRYYFSRIVLKLGWKF